MGIRGLIRAGRLSRAMGVLGHVCQQELTAQGVINWDRDSADQRRESRRDWNMKK